jgi:hypothetical protein
MQRADVQFKELYSDCKREATKLVKRKVLPFEDVERFVKLNNDPIRVLNHYITEKEAELADLKEKRSKFLELDKAVNEKYKQYQRELKESQRTSKQVQKEPKQEPRQQRTKPAKPETEEDSE